jgi:hypothetical protein
MCNIGETGAAIQIFERTHLKAQFFDPFEPISCFVFHNHARPDPSDLSLAYRYNPSDHVHFHVRYYRKMNMRDPS